jgi:general secretion pathway protein B
MSILLEALRKSEKGQTPVEPPTIHTDQHIFVASEPIRKGPVAGLLLLALVSTAWIVWRQYEPPVVNDQPAQTAPAIQGGTIKTPVSSMQSKDVAPGSTDSSKAAPTTRRTPVENYQPETPATSTPATSTPATSTPTTSTPATSTPATNLAGTVNPSTTGLSTTGSQPPVVAGAERLVGSGPAKEPSGTGGVRVKQPQPISYWELPDAIRAEVPEIKFSVLVYANEPADRFVLVNGQRLVEGDSYGQGLVVEEIRRDGVVFSYLLYRFLVER